MFSRFNTERGIAGIGAIIIFIAIVLVAAIAATLYVDTAGLLQSQAQNTGEDTRAEVSNAIQIVDIVGDVNANGTNVSMIDMNLRKAAGAGDIDLKMATIRTVTQDGATVLGYTSGAADAGNNFSVSAYRDDDASLPVLNSQDDRAKGTLAFDAASGAGSGLNAGEKVTFQITSAAGTTTTVSFTVPTSLDSQAGETILLR